MVHLLARIIYLAKIGLSEDFEAAKAWGEIATQPYYGRGIQASVPNGNARTSATHAEIAITRKQAHARRLDEAVRYGRYRQRLSRRSVRLGWGIDLAPARGWKAAST